MTQRIDVPGMGIVEFPDGMSDEQIASAIKKNTDWEGSSNQEKKPYDPMKSLSNAPGSAWNFAKGLVTGIGGAVAHPIDTTKSMLLAAEGGVRNLAPGLSASMDTANPFLRRREGATGKEAVQTADAIGEHYAKRYGGAENIKRTLEEDPVGVAADVSTVLGVGGALAPGKASQALNVASKYTNPLSVISPALGAVNTTAKNALGITTGAGSESVSQAFKAGKEVKPAFLENLKGDAPIQNIIDTAKQGLENMRLQKSADYRANMASVSKDKTILDFEGIDNALGQASDMVTFKGQVKNAKAAEIIQKMEKDVNWWRSLKADEFHTPEGLDALKQKLGGVLESIPYEEKTARLAAGKVYNAVKDEIQKQAPTYAKTMADYTKSSEQISEIERALSLGDKASKDTAIRKLQSLMRNNVQTNYGNRLDLAKQLESQGGAELMPSIAGQAMNSWPPRGLVGQAGAYGTAVAALGTGGMSLLGTPFQSPKAVGLGAYGLGRAAGVLGRGGTKLGVTPERARLAGLLGYELEQQ